MLPTNAYHSFPLIPSYHPWQVRLNAEELAELGEVLTAQAVLTGSAAVADDAATWCKKDDEDERERRVDDPSPRRLPPSRRLNNAFAALAGLKEPQRPLSASIDGPASKEPHRAEPRGKAPHTGRGRLLRGRGGRARAKRAPARRGKNAVPLPRRSLPSRSRCFHGKYVRCGFQAPVVSFMSYMAAAKEKEEEEEGRRQKTKRAVEEAEMPPSYSQDTAEIQQKTKRAVEEALMKVQFEEMMRAKVGAAGERGRRQGCGKVATTCGSHRKYYVADSQGRAWEAFFMIMYVCYTFTTPVVSFMSYMAAAALEEEESTRQRYVKVATTPRHAPEPHTV